jgi:hypothetical protein
MQVVIGHNRLAIMNAVSDSYGYFDPPSPMQETTIPLCVECDPNDYTSCNFTIPAFPHHGIIMWVNDDSGWQPAQFVYENGQPRWLFWHPLRINGQERVRFRGPDDTEERDYRIYLLP